MPEGGKDQCLVYDFPISVPEGTWTDADTFIRASDGKTFRSTIGAKRKRGVDPANLNSWSSGPCRFRNGESIEKDIATSYRTGKTVPIYDDEHLREVQNARDEKPTEKPVYANELGEWFTDKQLQKLHPDDIGPSCVGPWSRTVSLLRPGEKAIRKKRVNNKGRGGPRTVKAYLYPDVQKVLEGKEAVKPKKWRSQKKKALLLKAEEFLKSFLKSPRALESVLEQAEGQGIDKLYLYEAKRKMKVKSSRPRSGETTKPATWSMPGKTPPTIRDVVKNFLKKLAKKFPMSANEVKAETEAAGFSIPQLYQARRDLKDDGVELLFTKKRDGFHWYRADQTKPDPPNLAIVKFLIDLFSAGEPINASEVTSKRKEKGFGRNNTRKEAKRLGIEFRPNYGSGVGPVKSWDWVSPKSWPDWALENIPADPVEQKTENHSTTVTSPTSSEPTDGESAAETTCPIEMPDRIFRSNKLRPAYPRNHLWLKWYEEGLGIAKIRDRWNNMTERERKEIAPEKHQRIAAGKGGRDVVYQGINLARSQRS